jgi:hypothetical protein
MLSWIILGSGITLGIFIVFRGLLANLVAKYPFFYLYSASVVLVAITMSVFYAENPDMYRNWYWSVQLVTLVFGYGILLEAFNHVLSPYPGAEKFARISGLVVFGAIVSFAFGYPLIHSQWSASGSMMELERNLRMVQAIFLFGLCCVISYYRIPVGKNMKGMMVGYGLYIATSLMSLAVTTYQLKYLKDLWSLQPISYDISLLVWLVALWSYHANPVAQPSAQLEADYEACVTKTRNLMGGMRSSLAKVARP